MNRTKCGMIWSQALHAADQRRPFIHNATIRQFANIVFVFFLSSPLQSAMQKRMEICIRGLRWQYMGTTWKKIHIFLCRFCLHFYSRQSWWETFFVPIDSAICGCHNSHGRLVIICFCYKNCTIAKCFHYGLGEMRTEIWKIQKTSNFERFFDTTSPGPSILSKLNDEIERKTWFLSSFICATPSAHKNSHSVTAITNAPRRWPHCFFAKCMKKAWPRNLCL